MMLHLLTKETAAVTLDFDLGRRRRRDVCGDSAALLLQLHAAVLVHADQSSSNW